MPKTTIGRDIEAYVTRRNMMGQIFKQKALSLENREDRVKIASMIDSDLSPENLFCDGEIATLAETQYVFLMRCVAQLKQLDPELQFQEV